MCIRDSIKGVMLKPRGLAAGWGKLDEIRQGIAAVRKAGKPVYAWLATPGMREYYVAAGSGDTFLAAWATAAATKTASAAAHAVPQAQRA